MQGHVGFIWDYTRIAGIVWGSMGVTLPCRGWHGDKASNLHNDLL